jgi:hypothetical protein
MKLGTFDGQAPKIFDSEGARRRWNHMGRRVGWRERVAMTTPYAETEGAQRILISLDRKPDVLQRAGRKEKVVILDK